jgi:hypothetical protein
MDLTEGSETSTQLILTPGKYPKESIQDSEHGENLKSRKNKKNYSIRILKIILFLDMTPW